MGSGGGGILPSEYQQVEYLESTGTQYIDTGIYLTNTDIIKCIFEIVEVSGALGGIYGAFDTNKYYQLVIRNPIQLRVGTTANQVGSTNVITNQIYETIAQNGIYTQNNIDYIFTSSEAFTLSQSCYVFARNNNGQVLNTFSKIYSFEIVNKCIFIPCYRKSDTEPGMYDTVNNVFYTNAGTGSFIVGNDV